MLKPGTKIIAYGTKPNVSCAGAILESEPLLSLQCKLKGGDKIILKSNLFGRYNFENILAAVSIGDYLGVSVEGIKKGIENYIPSINRSQVIKRGSNLIYLDAYNANPTSMEMAIQNFGSLNAEKKIVILGDMKELGSETEKEHQAVVSQLKQYVFHEKILIGEYFRKHTREEGARYFPDAESAGKWIGEKKFSGAVFLIKGSRKMKLETLADHIS
jgi:UDP-N-acetylmuramoyl-tripeptide--D-alanyl-D-alanine ligase